MAIDPQLSVPSPRYGAPELTDLTEFSVRVTEVEGSPTLFVRGSLDVHHAPKFRSELNKVIDAYPVDDVIVDLSGVQFLDSVGLGVLVGGQRRAHQMGGDVMLASPSSRVRTVLEVTRLVDSFDVIPSATGTPAARPIA